MAGYSAGAAREAPKQARRAPQRAVHARDRGRRVGLGQPRLGDPHGRPVRLADALARLHGRAGLRRRGRVLGRGGGARVRSRLPQLRASRAGPRSAMHRAAATCSASTAAPASRRRSGWTGGGGAGARRACGNMPASAGCRRFHARDARASSRFSASCRRAAARGIKYRVKG